MQNNAKQKLIHKLTKPAFIVEVLVWAIFGAGIMLKCSYFQFITRLNIRPVFLHINVNMLFATLSSVMLIMAVIFIVFNKKRLIALLCFDLLLSFLIFSDTIYFRYYYNAISVPVLYQIGLVGSLSESIKSLLRIKDLINVIDIPFIIAGIFILRKITRVCIGKLHIIKRLITAAVVFAISFGVFQWTYGKASPANFPYDNNYVVSNLGIFYFHYYDTKRFIKEHYFTDHTLSAVEKKRIDEFYNGKKTTGEKYKGIAKGKNLIIVQMEAIQQFLINRKFNGREITPNLNKFINDSAYFDNFYYQIGGGNTADAEFLTNTSLYPLKEGSVYFRYPSDTYESTAKLLKLQGYNTYVFHANNPSFWNRTEMYKSLGFDKFFSSKSFTLDEYLGWGLGDKSFFRQSLEKFDTSKPFYGFFITLASHHPFNFFDNYPGFDVGSKYEKTFIGDYVKAANYADQAIGLFLDDLKKRGLYDNSIIVIYGDHNAIQKDQADLFKDFMSYDFSEFSWISLQKTPCFIRFPGMDKTGLQETVVGQIDILPTVANLMGFDAPHAMGKDIFNTEKGYAVLRTSSVITDDFTYINSDKTLHDNKGHIIKNNVDEKLIKAYQEQLDISDIIITKNAFKAVNKK